MTWGEIKKAVEKTDVKDTDEIYAIECLWHDGDKILHKSAAGKMIKLAEHISDKKADTHGCAT